MGTSRGGPRGGGGAPGRPPSSETSDSAEVIQVLSCARQRRPGIGRRRCDDTTMRTRPRDDECADEPTRDASSSSVPASTFFDDVHENDGKALAGRIDFARKRRHSFPRARPWRAPSRSDGRTQAVLAWEAERQLCGLQPLPSRQAQKLLRGLQRLSAWQAETQLRGLQPLPTWQAEKQLRGLQPLPAWQAETQLRELQPLPAWQAEKQLRELQPLPAWQAEIPLRGL